MVRNPRWRIATLIECGRVRRRAASGTSRCGVGQPLEPPDLSELDGLQPRGRIAVVLHLFYAELWDEMREAIEHISLPFDLFVSLVKGASSQMRETVLEAFPHAYVFDFQDRGRDIGAFLVFLESGVLFK